MDQCKYCLNKEELEKCIIETCSMHETWISKEKNKVIKELLSMTEGLLEYIDAIPPDIEFNCVMPGISRDALEDIMYKAKIIIKEN